MKTKTADLLSLDNGEDTFVRWERVLIFNSEWFDKIERIYLATIDWSDYPYIYVKLNSEKDFLEWKEFKFDCAKYIEKIPETITVTMTVAEYEQIKNIFNK